MSLIFLCAKSLKKIAKITNVARINSISNSMVMMYLKWKYPIKNIEGVNKKETRRDKEVRKVWVCWFQGERNAPQLVKSCIKSIRENLEEDFEIFVLDMYNFEKYVKIDPAIISKFNNGIINNTQMSDILRVYLLAEHGGIWIDATIYITNKKLIMSRDFSKPFSLIDDNYPVNSISEGNWAIFFLYMPKDSKFANLLKMVLIKYWKKENSALDYFITDYFFSAFYSEDSTFTGEIKNNSINGSERYYLDEYLSESKSQGDVFGETNTSIGIYKLSHKKNYKKSIDEIFP